MPRSISFGLLLLFGVLLSPIDARNARADDRTTPLPLDDAALTSAIEAITNELYARLDDKHLWEPVPWNDRSDGSATQAGGYNAIAALALLTSGQSYQEPRLRRVIDHLEKAPLKGTYAIAARAMVWARLPEKYRSNLERDLKWLLEAFDAPTATWPYEKTTRRPRRDNSTRQFGALALWEGSRRGARIDEKIWGRIQEELLASQLPDGGWNYQCDGDPARGSMTAAGVATLRIIEDIRFAQDAAQLKPAPRELRDAMDRGRAWLCANFTVDRHPGATGYFAYYLYAIERAALAGGDARFGDRDWFRLGATRLIGRILVRDESTGTWRMAARGGAETNTGDLAFALLFLSRGRVPIAVNKLVLDEAHAHRRPRDAANLVQWLGDRTEQMLNWQRITIEDPLSRWLESAFILLASDAPPPFVPDDLDLAALRQERAAASQRWRDGEAPVSGALPLPHSVEVDQLREYLGRGGMILASREGQSARGFGPSIERLGSMLFPEAVWRDLPPDHGIYRIHAPLRAKEVPLRALNNGVRDLIVLAPGTDLGQAWQRRDVSREEDRFLLGANAYFTATELGGWRPRLAAAEGAATEKIGSDAPQRRVVRAVHGGNWEAEPGALEALARWWNAQESEAAGFRVVTERSSLVQAAALVPPPAVVLVSGVDPSPLSEEEIAAISALVGNGVTRVLVATAGGRGSFARSAEAALLDALGAEAMPAAADTLFEKLQVSWRPAITTEGGAARSPVRLRGVRNGDRLSLIISDEDLEHALLDRPHAGVRGMTTSSAREVWRRLIQ